MLSTASQMHLPPSRRKSRIQVVPVPTALPPVPEGAMMHFDGACAPNPGPMSIGYHIGLRRSKSSLVRVGAPIGNGTNNKAEYHALLAGMRHALKLGLWDLEVRSDSLLVVNQMKGKWGMRDKALARLNREASLLAMLFVRFEITHIRREENMEADALSRMLGFEEPELPSPALVGGNNGAQSRQLFDWQAAAIRYWWHRYTPGAGTLSRIFGVAQTAIEQIGYGQTYKNANFDGYAAHLNALSLIEPSPVVNDTMPLSSK